MILLISSPEDESTSEVMEWIDHFGAESRRVHLLGEDFNILNDLSVNDLTAIWYRRGGVGGLSQKLLDKKIEKTIGNPLCMKVKKLEVLDKARQVGLETASSAMIDNLGDLKEFYHLHQGRIVLKSAEESATIHTPSGVWVSYTEFVREEFLDSLPDFFAPTFFEEAIPKKADLRVFYLLGECFPMAIFDLKTKDTKETPDIRKSLSAGETRSVPFKLPEEVSKKIAQLMDILGLNTGSLDFILTPEGKIIFLEVNPVGQFGMVSKPCNYHLEEKIARYLVYGETPAPPFAR